MRDTYCDKASEAFSQDFALGDAVVVSSSISYRSQSDIDTDVAAIHGPLIEPEVDTTNVGAPLSASEVRSLVAAVATRAAKG